MSEGLDDFFIFTGFPVSCFILFNIMKRSPSKLFKQTELFVFSYSWFCSGWGLKKWEVKNREIENKWRR